MADKSETELSETVVKNVKTNQDDDTPKTQVVHISIKERIKSFFTFFTVEPFLLCYVLPIAFSAATAQKFYMEKACRVDLMNTEEVCANIVAGKAEDNVTLTALDGAQTIVADMTAWKQPLQSSIPALIILFVGAWSDKTGNRKALMIVPIFGDFIATLGIILSIYFFMELPLWATAVIEALPSAFCGGFSVALMGSYSYVADVTTVESRTFRLGVVAVIVTLGIPLGSALSGYLTESIGYYGVYGICLTLYGIGFVHTMFKIKDVRYEPVQGSFQYKLLQFFHPKNAWDTVSLLFLSRGYELVQIVLVISAHIVITGPVFGENAVLYLYTLKKYQMDIIEFSLFTTYIVLIGIGGTAIAVTVFSKMFNMHDAIIGIIATVSKVLASFVYALAPTKNLLYFAPAIDFFSNSASTAIRSLGTKVVQPDKIAKMCSLIGLVEAIVPAGYTPLYSKVYVFTLDIFSGTFYLLGAIMTIPAIFIFIFLYMIDKRLQRDIVKNPDKKEMYAHENAITIL